MLQITVPGSDYFDERTNTFVTTRETVLQLEHSLVSLARWESKWNKAFLGKTEKTSEECQDYIRCMTITKNVDPLVYQGLTPELYETVNAYIEAPMTATRIFDKRHGSRNSETPTAEVIYYWMIALEIPFECQKWHLNRLMTLIQVCNLKNAPSKKMGRKEVMSRNRALNEARRRRLGSSG